MSTSVQTFTPENIAATMARQPYWTKVRVARQKLARHLGKPWDPNTSLPGNTAWVYVTAVDEGDIMLEGVQNVALRTFEVEPEVAARRIAERTHRLATMDEEKVFLQDRLNREAFCRMEEERTNPVVGARNAQTESSKQIAAAVSAIAENTRATRESVVSGEGDPNPNVKRR